MQRQKTQKQLAQEQLASQGLLTVRPSSREKALSTLKQRPASPSLGLGRRRRKTLRRRRHTKRRS